MPFAKGLTVALAVLVGSGAFPTLVAAGSKERYACQDSCVTTFANRSCLDQWPPHAVYPEKPGPCESAYWVVVSGCISRCRRDNPNVSTRIPGSSILNYLETYCQKPIEDAFPRECK
jgi:hypothetical protein